VDTSGAFRTFHPPTAICKPLQYCIFCQLLGFTDPNQPWPLLCVLVLLIF
jgi:hypothetical protein